MTTWYTADLHFGHANIAAYSGRPFDDTAEMNAAIIESVNRHVDPDDTLVVLGDVALGRIADTLPLVGLLHGHKLLVPGNHDRCWQGHGVKAERWRDRYLEAGFAEIVDDPDPVLLAGQHTLASHFPYRGGGDHGDAERHTDQRPVDHGAWLLCGHVHEKWKQRGRMLNVGIDAWGGRPVALGELEALVAAGPRDLPRDTWATPAGVRDGVHPPRRVARVPLRAARERLQGGWSLCTLCCARRREWCRAHHQTVTKRHHGADPGENT